MTKSLSVPLAIGNSSVAVSKPPSVGRVSNDAGLASVLLAPTTLRERSLLKSTRGDLSASFDRGRREPATWLDLGSTTRGTSM